MSNEYISYRSQSLYEKKSQQYIIQGTTVQSKVVFWLYFERLLAKRSSAAII